MFVKHGTIYHPKIEALPKSLLEHCGAFVSLHKKGNLRGCIGRFGAEAKLCDAIASVAIAAATQDYRFQKVTVDELPLLSIEISVLTPLRLITSIDEFELGKQGIYMVSGTRSGTFLPQVALETNWDKETFLGHCARDKAGLGWAGWKDATLYTYEAIVFKE
jgi:AmmeMemoRadiSam system protein A